MRRLAFAALVVVVAACGQARVSSTSGTGYTVTASLMQAPGKQAIACYAMPLPFPPIGCGGAPIADLDLKTMPDAQTFSNGVVQAGTYRLVGTWSAGSLHLTEPPAPAAPNSGTRLSPCAQNQVEQSPTDTPQGQKLIADQDLLRSRGIVLLEFYMCRGLLYIGVAVADKDTVDFLTNRYAPVEVAGWLQPAG